MKNEKVEANLKPNLHPLIHKMMFLRSYLIHGDQNVEFRRVDTKLFLLWGPSPLSPPPKNLKCNVKFDDIYPPPQPLNKILQLKDNFNIKYKYTLFVKKTFIFMRTQSTFNNL